MSKNVLKMLEQMEHTNVWFTFLCDSSFFQCVLLVCSIADRTRVNSNFMLVHDRLYHLRPVLRSTAYMYGKAEGAIENHFLHPIHIHLGIFIYMFVFVIDVVCEV